MERKISLDDHIKAIEYAVETISHVRRMAELDGNDMEEFDAKLNDLCTKYHEKFASMDEIGCMLHGLKVLIEAGKGKDVMRALMEDED